MQRPVLELPNPLVKLVFVGLLIVASAIVVTLLAFGMGLPFFGLEAIMGAFTGNLNNIAVLKYFQMSQSIALFIVPAWLAGVLFGKSTPRFLHFTRFNVSSLTVLMVAFTMLAAIPLIDFTGYVNQQVHLPDWMNGFEQWMLHMEENGLILIEKFTRVHTLGGLLINILMIGLLPALGEEMLFRGTIQPLVQKITKNAHVAVWFTAFLFSAMHMQFLGFIPRLLLGAIMGYLLVWSGSLWLPITAHFVNNTTGVVLYFLYYNNHFNLNPDNLGMATDILPLLLSIVLVSALMFGIKKQCKPTVETPENTTFFY